MLTYEYLILRKINILSLDILSSAESPSISDIDLHSEGNKFTIGVS